MGKDKNLGRSAGVMSFASAISRFTGVLNILVIAYAFGTLNYLQDSYNLANMMPNMLFELIAGGVLTAVFIPILVERMLKDEEDSWRLASNITNIVVVFLVIVATLGTIFSYYLIRAQTFMVSTSTVDIAHIEFFFRFFIWEIVFYGLTAVFNGILQAHRRFAAPAYAPIFNNIVVVITVLVFYLPLRESNPDLALILLAAGTALGIAAMAMIQIPALLKIGWRHRFIIDLRDPAIRKLALLAGPVLIYVISNQVRLTVSNALAWQYEGGITAFVYAWRFFMMPYGLLAVSISTVLFPGLSEQSVSDDMDSFKRTLATAVKATAFVMIPVSVFFYLLSEQTVGVFEAFVGSAGVGSISGVMALFVVGLLPFSLFMLLLKVFYALHDSVLPMKVNALGVPLNIALSFWLVPSLGVPGLALAHSLTYLFTMSLMFRALRRRIGSLGGRALLGSVAKFALISAPVGVIMFLLNGWLVGFDWPTIEMGRVVTLALAALVGGAAYIGLSAVAGLDEVRFFRTLAGGLRRRALPGASVGVEADPVAGTEDI